MRKILQSQDSFDSLALLDLDSGQITVVSKLERPDLSAKRIHGYYSKVNGKLFCLFVDNEQLFVKIDDQLIELTAGTTVCVEPVDEKRNLFEIVQDHGIILSWEYEKPENGQLLGVAQFFNPLISDEDYDICIFIYNVANNPSRRERIINSLNN